MDDWVALPPTATAVPRARRLVRHYATACGFGDDGVAELLAAELVTNAISHTATTALGIAIRASAEDLTVAVRDASVEGPRVRPLDGQPGGFGLRLVSTLASAWGFDPEPDGKRVWFRLSRTDGPAL